MTHHTPLNRRDFLTLSARTAAALAIGTDAGMAAAGTGATAPSKHAISFFSKQLHWLPCKDAMAAAAEIGLDGLDLTVRPKGHVLPERAEEDLPKAVEAGRANGVRVDMIVTAIGSPDEPNAEKILRTAAKLGVKHYRTNWFKYDKSAPVEKSLAEIEARLRALAQLNKDLGIRGAVQNHAGDYFGAAIWDLWHVLRKIDSEWIGSQYDIRHATVEGFLCWPLGLAAITPYIHTLNFKDFAFIQKDGKTTVDNVPLGTGLVDYKRFVKLLTGPAASAPVSLHCEYLPEKAPSGDSLFREEMFAAIRKDLAALKAMLG